MTEPWLLVRTGVSIDISAIRELQGSNIYFFGCADIRIRMLNRNLKDSIEEYMRMNPNATIPVAPSSIEMPPAAESPSRVAVKFNSDASFRMRVYQEFAQMNILMSNQ